METVFNFVPGLLLIPLPTYTIIIFRKHVSKAMVYHRINQEIIQTLLIKGLYQFSLKTTGKKHIKKHICSHLKANQLLHPNLSGFREHYSCHTALTTLVDKWLTHMNNNAFSAVVFVDIAKAFDVIDHDFLLRKLLLYRLSNDALRVFSSFLSNRIGSSFE